MTGIRKQKKPEQKVSNESESEKGREKWERERGRKRDLGRGSSCNFLPANLLWTFDI